MELSELKLAWDSYSSQEANKRHIGKGDIQKMIKTGARPMIDRIDRNIKIGMIVLLMFVGYSVVDILFLSKYLTKVVTSDALEYPQWLVPIDFLSTILIVVTYIVFVVHYLRIRKSYSIDLQINDLLIGIRKTLLTYRSMFYFAVTVLLINMAAGFAAGLSHGMKFGSTFTNQKIAGLENPKTWLIVGISLLFLTVLLGLTFILFRWAFNKLYGKYLRQISAAIEELEEQQATDMQ